MMEVQEQPIPQVKSSPYQSPMHQFSGAIMLLTNPDSELHKLELTLRNMVADQDGNVRAVGDPLLNDEGVNSVVGLAQALVNQVTVMSNLEKREVPMLIDFLGDTLAKDMMLNRKKYEISNAAARDKIYFEVLATAFVCMKRATDEGERRFWKGSQQEITTRVDAPQRKGVIGSVMGWGK